MKGWIGVDLDGTLAHYETGNYSATEIGAPIPAMLATVKRWLQDGQDVRIFTARVSHDGSSRRIMEANLAHVTIIAWCKKHVGQVLPITCMKDFAMVELYDDRCVQVEMNTGRLIGESTRGL